ncbi:SPFH domain-containing protein [Tundrisphaera lichenicola]|uniref:SPFH domain-containing protein n=1 Tax=Tundrisphaera lichenicola TaxID=2029860 RepID=UPI003EBA5132
MNNHRWIRSARTSAFLLVLAAFGYFGIWQWMVCRIEVPPGNSLLLRYKGPFPFAIGKMEQAPDGTLVRLDSSGRPMQVGILEAMPGPGRHFYSPLEFETELVPDILIEPGKIGLVTAKVGRSRAGGSYLVDVEGDRGVWRRVLTPGRYRFNIYGYDVKLVDVDACVETRPKSAKTAGDHALIPPGYVGVVTNKTGNPLTREEQGIQDDILQPGIYFLNPEEKRIDIISVGFNETTQVVRTRDGSSAVNINARLGETTAKDPDYLPDTGIEFPSNDGFPIHLDYTAIWGIMPDQAPDVVRQFGTLKDVEQKVILPQIGSICRLHGSKKGAVDLLVGDTREQFQTDTAEELASVLGQKNLTLLFGLTRHIYVPNQVREPIQKARVAEELTKTREQEQLTAKAQADLSEAKAKVIQEQERTRAETAKMIAEVTAEGEKKAKEIEATTERDRAQIDAKTAIVQAQITKTLGEANAKTIELSKQAEAERYRQYVQSLGGPDAYNRYVFAEGLPEEIRLGIFYAGPGTFWTDLKGFEQVMLGKLAEDSSIGIKKVADPKP